MIGQTISHFKIIEKLGEGGMGVVYKARDTKLDRDVALKFLSESLTPTGEDRRRFIREAKSAAALSHPNICTIFNIDEHEDTPFIVMEYINGKTLREIMVGGDLTKEKALEYAIRIADALGKAHQNDIIHRDIKPENIMVDEDGRIKVMDFGLAKLKQGRDITKTGDTVGTLAYSSPEQIRGEEVDHRSDQFSLGIVLYEMLTGRKPFQGEHQAAMTYSIVNEEPVPLKTYLPEAPEELERFFRKALAKDLEDRLGSAEDVAELMEDVKESYDKLTELNIPVEAGNETKEPSRGRDFSTISITLPKLGFGQKKIGWKGLIASVTVMLALVVFVGWLLIEGNGIENNKVGTQNAVDKKTSVAVLPFTNLTGNDKATNITKGLHADLLTRLSNISDLQMRSRGSVQEYSDGEYFPPVVAKNLGVRWILEGRVQEASGQVRVYAQLVDPETDSNIWAESYQRELTAENLFAIQGEIAREIARALQAELSEDEQQRIAGAPTQNLEAHRLYVQGRRLLSTRVPDSINLAIGYFERSLGHDSTYALAWSGLADALALNASYTSGSGENRLDSMRVNLPKAKKAAKRALRLDTDLAEAHASMALIYMFEQMVFQGQSNGPPAWRHLKIAVELKPSYAQAHHWIGSLYLDLGQPEQALKHLRLAIELNPKHHAARTALPVALLANGKYEDALQEAKRLKRMPQGEDESALEAVVLLHLKRWAEVRTLAREHRLVTENPQWWSESLPALADAATDNAASARAHIEKELTRGNKFGAWILLAVLGDIDDAYAVLPDIEKWKLLHFRVVRYHFPDLLSAFRDDPRYDKLIRDINQFWGLNPDSSIPNV